MIVYKICTIDENIPEYLSDACGTPELGRVRGSVYFHKSLKDALTEENLKSITWWEQQLTTKLVMIVPSTRGTFDGGTPNTVTGFGDDNEKMTGKTFTAVVNDANHTKNYKFYQALENNYRNYIFGFRTGSELRVATDVITGLNVVDSVEEDVNSNVMWAANVTWIQKMPYSIVPVYEIPDEVKDLFVNCIEEITAE